MGPRFLCLYEILRKSVEKWLSCGCLTDFKMAAAAMFYFWPTWILMVNLAAGPHFQRMYQIWCKYMQNGPLMAKSVISNMAAAAILDFVKFEFYW